jgi:hypothetical protein
MWEAAAELGWHEEGERGREGVGLAHRQGWRTGWSAGRRAEGWHDGLGRLGPLGLDSGKERKKIGKSI